MREFAHGLDEILVVEEKGPFLETHLKETPLRRGRARRASSASATSRASRCCPRELRPRRRPDRARHRRAASTRAASASTRSRRASGSSHEIHGRPAPSCRWRRARRSSAPAARTTARRRRPRARSSAPGSAATRWSLLNPEGKGEITGITQMGGEGAQWIGMAPFTDDPPPRPEPRRRHVPPLRLAGGPRRGRRRREHHLQAALQRARRDDRRPGRSRASCSIPDADPLARAEGVAADHRHDRGPERLPRRRAGRDRRGARPRPSCSRRRRSSPQVEGVTVLIHDQECAAEKRRSAQARQGWPSPTERVWINERVCEGCGDCGQKSNCLSVQPVETEFGRKTQIHQASCNKDFSCLEGDCPSFVTVVPGERAEARACPRARRRAARAAPARATHDDFGVRMMGIGGTGVVTVNQMLGMAALLDGLHVVGARPDRPRRRRAARSSRDLRITRDAARGREQGAGRQRRPLPRLRPARRRRARRTSCTADRERTVAVVSTSAVPDRPHGDRRGRALPGARGRARRDRRRHAARAQPLPRRPGGSPSACSATT